MVVLCAIRRLLLLTADTIASFSSDLYRMRYKRSFYPEESLLCI